MEAPFAPSLERFERMFGSAAAAARPQHLQLMLLGAHGGVDLHIPWESMLAASGRCSRHEDAFSWLAMSPDPLSIHLSLLDCVASECCALAGAALPRAESARALCPLAHGGSLIAHSPLRDDSAELARAACLAIAERIGQAAPGSRATLIEPGLSRALSAALLSPAQAAEFIGAAREALEISSCARAPSPKARASRPL